MCAKEAPIGIQKFLIDTNIPLIYIDKKIDQAGVYAY